MLSYMLTAALYFAACLLPLGFLGAGELLARLGDRPWRRRTPQPTVAPLERLSADLHRLTGQLELLERTNPPAKCARMKATTLAYDGVLLDACRALEVDTVAQPPLKAVDRLVAEAELAQRGLRW